MKLPVKYIALVATVGLGLTLGYMATHEAKAQSCQGTCSNADDRCRRAGIDAKTCNEARKQCMQTGTWVGPKSGQTFTNLCKV
jgi:hypothetical protein